MTEIVCIAAGIVVGVFLGMVVMCMLQINRINQYERRIHRLKKQLEEAKR